MKQMYSKFRVRDTPGTVLYELEYGYCIYCSTTPASDSTT